MSMCSEHDLMVAYPLALIVTAGAYGLMANPIPCVLYSEGPYGTLRFHLARANRQVEELRLVPELLAVFQGPDSYITPSWYEAKNETGKVVPTWNYVTVHAWGVPQIMDDDAWLYRQLRDLTEAQERARDRPWSVSDAPDAYIAAQLKGIIGVEVQINRIEGKWKVSQNRTMQDQLTIAENLALESGPRTDMAAVMRERGTRASPSQHQQASS